jgi:YbbR domain-containing protein
VRGPSRELARFEELDTEPVDLTGLSTNATREVATPAPAPGLRVDSSPVAVSISIAPNIIEKEFRGVPIAVQNTAGQATRTWPSSVALVLRGPQLTLNKIKLDKIVYIDAQGLTAGYYDALLEVNLPDGIELVHQAPEKVKMRIYRGKGPSQGG